MIERLSIFKELLNASIFLALITSLLYISGTSYIEGYLSEWGVKSSLIRSNTQEILVQGSIVWFIGGIHLIIAAILFGISVFLPIYMIAEISKSPLVRRISIGIYEKFTTNRQSDLEPPEFLQSFIKTFLYLSGLIAFVTIFLFSFYRLLEFSNAQGKEQARFEYNNYSSATRDTNSLFSQKKVITINGAENEGYILSNSDSFAVIYLPAATTKLEKVLVIPLNAISQMKSISK